MSADEKLAVAAGGVVARAGATGLEIAVAEQIDWRTGDRGLRLPKGHLDPGETPEQAALREVHEETGLRARILAPLETVEYRYPHPKGHTVCKRVHFFLMAHESGEPHAADGEMERVWFCPLDEALAALRFDTERRVVAAARAAAPEHGLL